MYFLRNDVKDKKELLVKVWILYCFFVFVSTEILSFFNGIGRINLTIIYGILFIVLFLFTRNSLKRLNFKLKFSGYWKWYLLLFLVVLLPLFLIAIYYPPNNYDSMTYHLPRVEHWIQNKNIDFYQTNNSRQLFLAPMAEYIILHWRLLAGEDYFVNLVQYVSMILSIIVAALIVKHYKGSRIAELLSVVLVATIPMGILQSTSTQNDYVTAFFVIASLYFFLKDNIFFLSLCIGLGIFTKNTYVIFVLPLGVYWLFIWIKKKKFEVWKRISLILFFILLINGAHLYRNLKYFGSPFGPKDMSNEAINQSFAPKYIVSNMVRNLGINLSLPNYKFNSYIKNLIENIHQNFGISSNDYVNTWYSERYIPYFAMHEDYAGNFVLIVLFLLTSLISFLKLSKIAVYYIVLLVEFFLFNLVFKWQPWHSRLLLPWFVLICPIIGLTLVKFINKSVFIKLIMVLLLFLSIPFILGYLPFNSYKLTVNSNRPFKKEILLNKSRYQRFISSNKINGIYCDIIKKIKEMGSKSILLDINSNSWEYPLWVCLRKYDLDLNVNYFGGSSSFDNLDGSVLITDKTYDIKTIKSMDYGLLKLGY